MRTLSSSSGIDPWRALEALSFYRAAVCVALLSLSASSYRPPYFTGPKAGLIDLSLYCYLFLAALLLILVRSERPNVQWQSALHVGTDMSIIMLLVYGSGGIGSGLGALLVTPVAAGSLLFSRRVSILPPALATIALLCVELYLNLESIGYDQNYTQTGILGAGLFIIAITGGSLARRARESEARASQAQNDIAKLAMLSESVIQKMQTGVLVADAEGRIELMNRSARQLLGASASPGRHLSAAAPEVWQKLRQWRDDPAMLTNSALSLANNQTAWAQFTRVGGGEASTLIVLDDASRVAEQAQSMKLASLGRLTASIAHELRNPLAAIQHAAELVSESPDLNASDRPMIEIVQRQSNRLSEVITSILSLSRKPQAQTHYLPLRPLIENSLEDFLRTCPEPQPDVTCDIEPERIAIGIELIQWEQIFGNLLENAKTHAMVENKRLEISVQARMSAEGHSAQIDIKDNGPGIPKDLAVTVFEPFFSTHHQGTGLGLFITKELCNAVEGDLQLVSTDDPASGAFFRLSFPATVMAP